MVEVLVPQETQAVTEQPTVGMVLPTLLSPLALMVLLVGVAMVAMLERSIFMLLVTMDVVAMVAMLDVLVTTVGAMEVQVEVEVLLLFINVPLRIDVLGVEMQVLENMVEGAGLH